MHEFGLTPLLVNNDTASASLQCPDGKVLYHQGDSIQDVYLITCGYVKFTQNNRDGRATITSILGPGQLIGEGLGMSDGTNIRAGQTATTKGAANLHRYSQAAFRQLLQMKDDLAEQVIAMLAQRQRLIERRLQAVLHLSVRARIALVLNDLSRHYGGRCAHGHEVDVPLTQQELSELVGASRPVVSSHLNELRREGLLDYSRGFICVDNLQALGELAQAGASEV